MLVDSPIFCLDPVSRMALSPHSLGQVIQHPWSLCYLFKVLYYMFLYASFLFHNLSLINKAKFETSQVFLHAFCIYSWIYYCN